MTITYTGTRRFFTSQIIHAWNDKSWQSSLYGFRKKGRVRFSWRGPFAFWFNLYLLWTVCSFPGMRYGKLSSFSCCCAFLKKWEMKSNFFCFLVQCEIRLIDYFDERETSRDDSHEDFFACCCCSPRSHCLKTAPKRSHLYLASKVIF